MWDPGCSVPAADRSLPARPELLLQLWEKETETAGGGKKNKKQSVQRQGGQTRCCGGARLTLNPGFLLILTPPGPRSSGTVISVRSSLSGQQPARGRNTSRAEVTVSLGSGANVKGMFQLNGTHSYWSAAVCSLHLTGHLFLFFVAQHNYNKRMVCCSLSSASSFCSASGIA